MAHKLRTLDQLQSVIGRMRTRGKRIVLTNGCFELLHVGHIRYLQSARALGDALVVGLNSDASVRAIKGAPRPLVSQAERAELLAALECVDYVVIFDEPTAESLVGALKPETYVKGGDYTTAGKTQQAPANAALGRPAIGQKVAPEMSVVQAYGGEVVILPYSTGHSTTRLIESILQSYGTQR